MPTAPVGLNTELYFTDSGPIPHSRNYTTLVLYHGMTFNGGIFQKLSNLGRKHNVRIVILNRREYAGSTKYLDQEIADLHAGRPEFWERLAVEVANFLLWFAETYGIPNISPDSKSGGYAVMSWSMGVTTPISLLGRMDIIPNVSKVKLEKYLRRFIIFDPPHYCLGYDLPPGGYVPMNDPELKTPEDISKAFNLWVSSYWEHPSISSNSLTGLQRDTKVGDNPTIESMTPEEIQSILDGEAGLRSDLPMIFPPMLPALKDQAYHALFDEKFAQSYLTGVQIAYMYGSASPWVAVWTFTETERRYNELVSQGHKLRAVRFIEVTGGNHLTQWDNPELMFAAIVDAINH